MSKKKLLGTVVRAAPIAYAFASLVVVTGDAHAQDRQPGVQEEVELVVTARRIEERLIDVPAAISVVTGADVQNSTMSSLSDISQVIPNVRASDGSLAPNFTIRGISSQSGEDAGFPPAVGVYIDDVFMGRDRAFNTVMNDVARIEVLRGPQGTLYGKNTIAGTINVITRRPDDEFRANADLTFGNLDYRQFRGSISGPLVEGELAASLSYITRERDGYIQNETTGSDRNDLDAEGGRFAAVLTPTSDWAFIFSADYYNQSDSPVMETTSYVALPIPSYATVPAQSATDRIVNRNIDTVYEREMWGTSLRMEHDINPNLQVTSISAYREYTSDGGDDSDGLPLDQFNVGRAENMQSFSQEVRFNYDAGGRFSWVGGVYYYQEDIQSFRRIRIGPDFPLVLINPMAPALPPTFEETARTDAFLTDDAWAVFGAFDYELSDRLTLSGGLRFTDEERTVNYTQQAVLVTPVNVVQLFAINVPTIEDERQDSEWTGDLSLSYDFAENTTGYLRYARGFKAGGFLAEVLSPPPFTPPTSIDFAPEFVDNYEVGFRTTLLDGRVGVNLTAFYLDFTDKQEKVNTGISYIISNAAEATSQGVEAELYWRITDSLRFETSFSTLDATYSSFPNAGGLGVDFSGNQLVGAPEFSGMAALQYDGPSGIANFDLFARAEIIHSDTLFTDTSNSAALEQNSYNLVNARLGLHNDNYGVYLWGRNLTDEDIIGGGVRVFSVTTRWINAPATYGVELRYQY